MRNKKTGLPLQSKTEKIMNLSNEKKLELAAQLAVMDSIEKGHTNVNELTEYVKSPEFEKALRGYYDQMGNW